ncbi:ATP-binding protein [Phaeocystidibacter marisrubri]|uniref:histidine kinase n=1 Tax=Phaeocystidibacter marisrubri TaxID=1577780 RepID=A0A6L3ZJP5_9FLAO|nr:ATP-binding protein [Phaeocystidibacter marisrubri]KAB2817625.1 PAS domain S-box protein [Phaeocystidibacter marisrubri]GGH74418.1 hypothetical protein GCM10011318_20380 [Phaeocystidibacter marisrubri]
MTKQFLKLFIPIAVLALTITSTIYRMHYTRLKSEVAIESQHNAESILDDVILRFISIGRGLNGIASTTSLDSTYSLEDLSSNLKGYIYSRHELTQVRFIDTTGMEVIRFNRKNNIITRTPDSLLQNKSKRAYFRDHINDEPNTLGFTPLDLNMENGQYEYPYVIVIRWSFPLFASDGTRMGMLVANIDARELFDDDSFLNVRNDGALMFATQEGAVYYNDHIYFQESADSLFSAIGFEGWEVENGFSNDKSIFFRDLRPSLQQMMEDNLNTDEVRIKASSNNPTMVLYRLPYDSYIKRVHVNLPYIFIIQSFFVTLIAFFCYRWARFRKLEQYSFSEVVKANRALNTSEAALKATKKELEILVRNQRKELTKNAQLLSTLFDSSIHYAGVMDTDGRLIDVNRRTLETLGIDKKYVEGKFVWDFPVFGDQEQVRKNLTQAIAVVLNDEVVHYETTMIDKQGKKRRIAFSLTPLKNEAGEITNLIPEGVDITELHEKDRQLHALIDQMETRNKQLKEFSHIISHNVRSPIGNLGLLLSIYDDAEDNEERAEIVAKLKEVNHSLQNLLEELLETVKILDNAEIKTQIVDIEPAIEQAQKLLARQIEETNAQIHVDLSAVKKVYFPKVYLNSLLLNLMSNAIKYRSEERQLELNISTRVNEAGRTELIFSDNGSGIDMNKNAHKVFGLYKTFHRSKPGKGLGLFMTKTQIESCGGQIKVTSKLDVGTTFTIIFPSSEKR